MDLRKHFKIGIATLALLLLTGKGQAQMAKDITHDQAHTALLAAKKKAEESKVCVNIAVVDAGANLKAFIRMDESFLGSIDVAIKKAKTARYFNIDTGKLGELTQPGGIIYNIEHSNGGLITFPGGIPIKNQEGQIIGAIGVSGGTIDEDRTIAMAGASSIIDGSN
ncbi:heme-binding protein [Zobellia galactanivorans]|uniref:Protein glcG n=1 Tax=Zobellia galactanivorans (strain DSM 12802 / CCUG 47099 / CIP 106680 / NCIMB 13871 / Dsij) TaxID=63186 RepID=G0L7R3_ZOBGA|nr:MULTISPECIES: heme-binding protein [Zobellia]MBU3025083.1 heme-binding protein [Zobellia galactanivorans]MDO6808617.1 heme-binding protein [Zobellia galactanivorans]OWW25599.1 PduO protein [Zobellia sp. OII3]CAZ98222.1 Protein glcG [Zobellia galactanivorans]